MRAVPGQILVPHHLEGRGRGRADRVATIGPAVRAGRPLVHQRAIRDDGRHRHAGGESLGGGHDVRHDVEVLVGPHLAGAPHAGLDLVQDQHDAVLVAQRAHHLEPALGRDEVATLADDGLDQTSPATSSGMTIWSKSASSSAK